MQVLAFHSLNAWLLERIAAAMTQPPLKQIQPSFCEARLAEATRKHILAMNKSFSGALRRVIMIHR